MGINNARIVSVALTWGIGVLSLVLVLELLWFVFGQSGASPQGGQFESIDKTQTLSIRDIGAEPDYQEISDRPLFNWNRKPIQIDASEPKVATSDIESRWELSGIVAAGKANFAYFKPLDGGEPTRLEEGMYFEKWKVVAIGQEQVVLSTADSTADGQAEGGEQKVFRLREMAAPEKPKKGRKTLAKRKADRRKQLEKKPAPKRAKRADVSSIKSSTTDE